MILNSLLSFLLIIPSVLSALVTNYIVTTNVAGAVVTLTSIYDPATAVTSVKTLNPITVTNIQTAANGALQTVITTYTPLVSQYLTVNAAGQTITATTTTTPGFVTTNTAAAAAAATATTTGSSSTTTGTSIAGVTTLNPVVSTIVQTAADGSVNTIITTYTPYISQVLSTNPAGVPVTVTATITPGLSSTITSSSSSTLITTTPTSSSSSSSSSSSDIATGMTSVIVTSSLADGALTTYTTVIPLASVTTSKYSNPRHRPDPSTSRTPEPATPVTTLSWQSWATITEGDTTYTKSLSPIIIWITVTSNGALATISTTFIQRFSTQYSTIAQPSSGSIGLGTISGQVGVVKSPYQTTIKFNNALNLQPNNPIFSICAILLSWLL